MINFTINRLELTDIDFCGHLTFDFSDGINSISSSAVRRAIGVICGEKHELFAGDSGRVTATVTLSDTRISTETFQWELTPRGLHASNQAFYMFHDEDTRLTWFDAAGTLPPNPDCLGASDHLLLAFRDFLIAAEKQGGESRSYARLPLRIDHLTERLDEPKVPMMMQLCEGIGRQVFLFSER